MLDQDCQVYLTGSRGEYGLKSDGHSGPSLSAVDPY